MRTFLLGLIIISICPRGFSQESKAIPSRINASNIFTTEKELKDCLNLCDNDTVKLFFALSNCKIDSLPEDKLLNSISLLKNLAVRRSSEAVKTAAINFFLASVKSKSSGVSTLSFKALNGIPSRCFKNESIDSISSLIVKHPLLYKESVLLSGYIGTPVFIESIKSVFPNSRAFSKHERWASYKALARLGDKEALEFCLKRVSTLPLNDQVVDILFPDLIYIHRKEAFDILIKALNSKETLCSSSNPNSDNKIVCGYRIMEMLAPEIENFPVKVLPSGDLATTDYVKALNEIRAWFLSVGSNYSIINR